MLLRTSSESFPRPSYFDPGGASVTVDKYCRYGILAADTYLFDFH